MLTELDLSNFAPLLNSAFLFGIAPLMLAGLVAWILLRFLDLFDMLPKHNQRNALFIAFAVLGTMLGVFIGASREPAVGAVLPGVITLISGIAIIAFNFEKTTELRPIIPMMIIALVVGASGGGFFGSEARQQAEDATRIQNFVDEVNLRAISDGFGQLQELKNICTSTCLKAGQLEPNACAKQCAEENLIQLNLNASAISDHVNTLNEP